MEPDPELIALRTALDGSPPATLAAIRETERLIDFEFPPNLVAFFKLCDGGEGWWGDNYLRIDSLGDLRFQNTAPHLQRYFSDIVVFGGDGGGEWHAFLRGQRWTIVLGINPLRIGFADSRPAPAESTGRHGEAECGEAKHQRDRDKLQHHTDKRRGLVGS